jgi:hypothetical protein
VTGTGDECFVDAVDTYDRFFAGAVDTGDETAAKTIVSFHFQMDNLKKTSHQRLKFYCR